MKIVNAKEIDRANNWKALIYSKPGTGKTSMVRNLPGKTLLLDLDNSSRVLAGADNIDVVEFDRTRPNEDMLEFMGSFENLIAQNGYNNIVIDNISSFEKDWFTERARASKSHLNNQLQDYSAWSNYFTRIMAKVLSLKNANVLITAWETTFDITAANGQQISAYAPMIRKQVLSGLMGLTDLVGRLVISPRQEDKGTRFVFLQNSDSLFAKNRIDQRAYCKASELFNFAKTQPEQAKSAPKKQAEPTRSDLNKAMIKHIKQYSDVIDVDLSQVMQAYLNVYHGNGNQIEHLSDLNDDEFKNLIKDIKKRFVARDKQFIEDNLKATNK